MATNTEVYHYEEKIERLLARIRESQLVEENRQALEGFKRWLVANGLSGARTNKYLIETFKLAQFFPKRFVDYRKEDVLDVVHYIETNKKWNEQTKHDYKLALKKLFKFLRGTEDYPDEVAWVKIWDRPFKPEYPEILTEKEVRRLAEVCARPRDKALVLFLYESGCRIGELVAMRIRDVVFDKYGVQAFVNGKTGPRRIRVIACVPALAFWIGYHPEKANRDAFLWPSMSQNKIGRLVSPAWVAKLLKTLAIKAGITKRMYPHLFRHSRATHLAKVLPESMLRHIFGWTMRSDEPERYVHLSGRDVDEAILKVNGLELEEQDRPEKFRILTCDRCGMKNSPGMGLCVRCGSPLSLEFNGFGYADGRIGSDLES